MGETRWWGVVGVVSALALAGSLVGVSGVTGASTSPTARWFTKYGGHVKAINNDVTLMAADGQADNPRFVQDCRALTSDASDIASLPPVPNKAINKAMANAALLLSEAGIDCQATAAGSNDPSTQEGPADLRNGSTELRNVEIKLRREGLLLSHVKAKHTVVASSTPTTTTPTNHVGATLSTSTIAIQLQQVIDPASADNPYVTPDTGDRFVGVKVQISNPGTANIEDDANNDFTVIGSNGQIYSPDFDALAGCTNFNDGDYGLTPGASVVGCVTFQVPTGVNVTQVDFVGSDSRAQWQVP